MTTREEQQAMVDRFKTNIVPAGLLKDSERLELIKHAIARNLIGYYGENAGWKPWGWDAIYDTQVYRLAADFQLPPEEITAEPGYRIVTIEEQKRCKFPMDCVVRFYGRESTHWSGIICHEWRPFGDGIEVAYAVPTNYVFAEDRPKERGFFNIITKEAYTPLPINCKDFEQSPDWIEITTKEKEYIETKHEGYELRKIDGSDDFIVFSETTPWAWLCIRWVRVQPSLEELAQRAVDAWDGGIVTEVMEAMTALEAALKGKQV